MKPHRRRRHRRAIRFKTRRSITREIPRETLRETLRRQDPGVIAAAVAGHRATWRNNRR
jgi:hypothetical protein